MATATNTMATATEKPTTTTTRGAGPLTTVFKFPDFCQSPWWNHDSIGTPAVSSSVCMPGNFVAYFGNRSGMYSPGICPMSYTEGCPFPSSDARLQDGKVWAGGPVVPGETARICCPEGYTCRHDTTTSPDVQWRKCIRAGPDSMTRFTGTDGVVTTTMALAYAIQVRWQSSDLSILETDPTVPGSKYSTPAETTTVTSDGDGGGGGGDGGGNSTTVLVVGIVVPVISLLLGILGFLFWRHHYRTKYGRGGPAGNNSSTTALKDLSGRGPSRMSSALTLHTDFGAGSPTGGKDGGDDQKHDYYGPVAAVPPSEMDAVVVHEADGRTRHRGAELPADERPQEMPGGGAVFVAELADTSVAANATANDVAGPERSVGGASAARRKSLREPGRSTT